MTLVKGPNGHVWDLDPVVASGLLGSPSGEYTAATPEPRPDVSGSESDRQEPVRRRPRKTSK